MKLPIPAVCVSSAGGGNSEDTLRPEKFLLKRFRTRVQFPPAPPAASCRFQNAHLIFRGVRFLLRPHLGRVSFLSTKPTSPRTAYRSRRLFCKSRLSLTLSKLLSESNPLTLGFDSVFVLPRGIFFANASHIKAAVGICPAAAFMRRLLCSETPRNKPENSLDKAGRIVYYNIVT